MKHIGSGCIFMLDMIVFVLLGLLFGIVFVGAQIASWTGSES